MRLDLHSLRAAYAADSLHPADVVEWIYDRIRETGQLPVWISLVSREKALQRSIELASRDRERLPLYGVPFAVKDNMDVAGMETTAGCPAYAYVAAETATVVQRLIDAGAMLIGKTNLDQFATGLVGVRSPYGACSCTFNDEYISGGSSSGSAVAVARGLVSFSLGTDTAGSGRVPASFNNIVGLKPTRGLLSTAGVVPACRSLDCVSIFAGTAHDAAAVWESARTPVGSTAPIDESFRFGCIPVDSLADPASRCMYAEALDHLEHLGGMRTEIDFAPFRETADLLYSGPWVAERYAAIEEFFKSHADDMDPTVRTIIGNARSLTAADAFRGLYRLEELQKRTAEVWARIDVLALPTAPAIYKIAQVQADPIALNSNLGSYTNFVNLLDLAAVAVPAGMRPDGLPFGLSLIGPALTDQALLRLADRLHRTTSRMLGATEHTLEDTPEYRPKAGAGRVLLAVVGAHLTGQPLNHQLVTRGARLMKQCRTAAGYRLYALRGTQPPKPGLVRDPGAATTIELEVWAIPEDRFGSFVAEVPQPLGIGSVTLDSGDVVKSFICEPYAIRDSEEITHHGGWRNYLAAAVIRPTPTLPGTPDTA